MSIALTEEHDACGIGFVADTHGAPSHRIIEIGLAAVGAMHHRGAVSADGRTGDGAGIACETPRAFFARELNLGGVRVPAARIAALSVFLPRSADLAGGIRALIEAAVRRADVIPLRWRRPPIDERVLGEHARTTRPHFEHLLLDCGPGNVRERMRTARALIERALRETRADASLVSASENTIIYKALLSSNELGAYFADLRDPLFAARYAMFHQRFSTNSAPSWKLVQPFSQLAHNGEINTITGNRAWLDARGVKRIAGASDSYDLDVALGAMVGAGYRIDHAVDLLLAPAIPHEDERLRAYYDAHLPTVEPWDGPAALVFADGDVVGAALDRAGLRPLRWSRTAGNIVLAASEAGVVDFGHDPIIARGRLGPGGRLVVRISTGDVLETDAFRAERRASADFRPLVRTWAGEFPLEVTAADAPLAEAAVAADTALAVGPPTRELARFGWKKEEVHDVVGVLADGREPILSMGDDAALAIFERGIPVAGYLRQRFAQVTNPPIDPLREAFVFDMRAFVGAGDNNCDVPGARTIIMLENGIIAEHELDALLTDERLSVQRLSLEFSGGTLAGRLDGIVAEATAAVASGASLLLLDDRTEGLNVPVVLAAGAVHHALTQAGLRMAASIAAADGAIRDAHGAAAVLAMGANVVSPWLAERTARGSTQSGAAYIRALRAGLMKILAKLGICTLRSYVGAQTFEALGLDTEIIARCFPGVRAHVPAMNFAMLEDEIRGWLADAQSAAPLRDRGSYRYRREGLRRAFDPNVIKNLRATALRGDYAAFEELSNAMEARAPLALRDILEAHTQAEPISVDLVQSEASLTRSFVTAAMSLGSLAPEVHEVIAQAANALGARSNSGEGGEHARRFARSADGRSRIKQIASARFGVGIAYLASADEIEIKIAQGSKPGEGGQIPGNKVSVEIAALRGAVPGRPLISPPPHHDIYSIEDLAELIYDLRRAAPHARIAVKLVSQSGIGYVACGVAKAGADTIHISGHDGGTGASPLASIKHAGLPWELGLVETHHALLATGLRARVVLRVDGGLKSGRDVIIAALLGAEEFGFGSALLVALGCIYARQCHKNTCPVGIATQDVQLRAKFAGTAEQAQTYLQFIARDIRRRLATLGVRSLKEIHGRSDLLRRRSTLAEAYAHIDLAEILRLPEEDAVEHGTTPEHAHLDDAVGTMPVLPIAPRDRAVGARLAALRVIRADQATAPPETVHYRGTAGQSFGAFLTEGVSLILDGDANDYVGKSMDGGLIVIRGHNNPHEPAAGNACFYGARGGRAFIAGGAGERFAVRNSGAQIVLEGAGDHLAEYMTAGVIVVLGPVGRNIAAGMSGGTVFLREPLADVQRRLGPTDCALSVPDPAEPAVKTLHALLSEHAAQTGSRAAAEIIAAWPAALAEFTRIGDA